MRRPLLRKFMIWGVRLITPRHRVGVSVVLADDEERVLLLRHVFHPDVQWGLPGGWLEAGESPVVGALRELAEETGLTAELGPVVHVNQEPYPSHIGIAFSGRVIAPAAMRLSSEIMEATWFPATQLPTPLHTFTRTAIRATLQKRASWQVRTC